MCQLIEKIRAELKKGPVDNKGLQVIMAAAKSSINELQEELCHQDWEPGRYMLYKDPQYGFVVMMLVWGVGDKTPIHAHGTWGVEAIIKNNVRVTTYSNCPVSPKMKTDDICAAGDIAFVLPPDDDVHVVAQEGLLPAISVHIYGHELVNNIVFYPGEGFKATPVTCRKVSTKLFDLNGWFVTCHHKALTTQL
jgi:predicted metal-dependent enzyme (double-stranded beta helix superfamily)